MQTCKKTPPTSSVTQGVCVPVSRYSFQRHSWKIVLRTSRRSHYRGRSRRWKSVRCVNKSRAIFKTLHYGISEQNAVPKCIWPKGDPEINSQLICAVGCFSFFFLTPFFLAVFSPLFVFLSWIWSIDLSNYRSIYRSIYLIQFDIPFVSLFNVFRWLCSLCRMPPLLRLQETKIKPSRSRASVESRLRQERLCSLIFSPTPSIGNSSCWSQFHWA